MSTLSKVKITHCDASKRKEKKQEEAPGDDLGLDADRLARVEIKVDNMRISVQQLVIHNGTVLDLIELGHVRQEEQVPTRGNEFPSIEVNFDLGSASEILVRVENKLDDLRNLVQQLVIQNRVILDLLEREYVRKEEQVSVEGSNVLMSDGENINMGSASDRLARIDTKLDDLETSVRLVVVQNKAILDILKLERAKQEEQVSIKESELQSRANARDAGSQGRGGRSRGRGSQAGLDDTSKRSRTDSTGA